MGFFTLAKRCAYCVHKVDENGKCVNEQCIAYKPAEEAPAQSTETEDSTVSE